MYLVQDFKAGKWWTERSYETLSEALSHYAHSPYKHRITHEGKALTSKGHGIFRDHSCWKCQDGQKLCVNGNPDQCDYPHARND